MQIFYTLQRNLFHFFLFLYIITFLQTIINQLSRLCKKKLQGSNKNLKSHLIKSAIQIKTCFLSVAR